jgi:hypothetical protein
MSSAVSVIANQERLRTTGGSEDAKVNMLTGHSITLVTNIIQAIHSLTTGFLIVLRRFCIVSGYLLNCLFSILLNLSQGCL